MIFITACTKLTFEHSWSLEVSSALIELCDIFVFASSSTDLAVEKVETTK